MPVSSWKAAWPYRVVLTAPVTVPTPEVNEAANVAPPRFVSVSVLPLSVALRPDEAELIAVASAAATSLRVSPATTW